MHSKNLFLQHTSIKIPIICAPMYPCSNPELVAAASNAGGIGIVQPITLTYIFGYDFAEGLRYIRSLTSHPIGMNVLIEKSSSRYIKKMETWVDIALEEGVRFFITSLGNPDWVVKKVHAFGGIVYHDVTEVKWADIAVKAHVDGLIAVNSAAGGHAGIKERGTLLRELQKYHLPLICAGGIGDGLAYHQALEEGYDGAQIGTRFIASSECAAPYAYKKAIVDARKEDIVLTQALTGIPLSVINNPAVPEAVAHHRIITWLLKRAPFKRLLRLYFALKALKNGKNSMKSGSDSELWVAGKSVEGIHSIEPVAEIIHSFEASRSRETPLSS